MSGWADKIKVCESIDWLRLWPYNMQKENNKKNERGKILIKVWNTSELHAVCLYRQKLDVLRYACIESLQYMQKSLKYYIKQEHQNLLAYFYLPKMTAVWVCEFVWVYFMLLAHYSLLVCSVSGPIYCYYCKTNHFCRVGKICLYWTSGLWKKSWLSFCFLLLKFT